MSDICFDVEEFVGATGDETNTRKELCSVT